MIGVGGEHGSILAAFLDLPSPHKWKKYLPAVEQYMHPANETMKKQSEDNATITEINETMKALTYPIEQTFLEKDEPLHRIAASYDMGWHVRLSGGKYGSRTGHALLIGAATKKVLDSIVYNKKCVMCSQQTQSGGRGTAGHSCLKKYDGLSKSIDASGLVTMLQRMPEEKGASVCIIISDDNSNAQAKAQNVTNGGALPDGIEEPQFLADPSHRKRVFARHIYNLANAPVKINSVTKNLAVHLKYCYGVCIKRYRHLTTEELSKKSTTF